MDARGRCTAAECQEAELAAGQVGLLCGQGHRTPHTALASLFINTADCPWDEHIGTGLATMDLMESLVKL